MLSSHIPEAITTNSNSQSNSAHSYSTFALINLLTHVEALKNSRSAARPRNLSQSVQEDEPMEDIN